MKRGRRQCVAKNCNFQVHMLGSLYCAKHCLEQISSEEPSNSTALLGGIPTCAFCHTQLTPTNCRSGDGLCYKHKSKRTDVTPGNAGHFRGQGIRWDLIFVTATATLLHDIDTNNDNFALQTGLQWISSLAMRCDRDCLSSKELAIWFDQESYDSEKTIALLKAMGSEPLTWLLEIHNKFATDEQKKNLSLFFQ